MMHGASGSLQGAEGANRIDMEAPAKIAEVDFRFAGAEDTAEILCLVRERKKEREP